MPSERSFLADVNVWLATIHAGHRHHERALAWWRQEVVPPGARVYFCRISQLALLRLVCNRRVMGAEVRDPDGAWRTYAQLLAQGPVGYAREPLGLGRRLQELTRGRYGGPGIWTDVYLAAFASCASLVVVTLDRALRKFDGEVAVDLLD